MAVEIPDLIEKVKLTEFRHSSNMVHMIHASRV